VAVRIRLQRVGRRHRAAFRVAVMDARAARDSKVIEQLGQYDPVNQDESAQIRLDRERYEYWVGVGAQPSDTVRRIYEKVVAAGPEAAPSGAAPVEASAPAEG
jgi:small subunit ribosomal protein S16